VRCSDLAILHICVATKTLKRRAPALALVLLSFAPLPGGHAVNPFGSLHAAQRAYISKDYVDTVVQQAFNSLNEAMSIPGADFKHRAAIEDARRVAKRLKSLAAGDPNAQYILFRAGELEQQLWLEENDLDLQKTREVQKLKNACIDTFNIELGKKRPDFANLGRLVARIDAFRDPDKADEMRRSQAQRKTSVSRELTYRFERAFANGDLDTARKELDYCSRNRAFLALTDASYNALSDRIRLQTEAIRKRPSLEADLKRGRDCLARNQLRETWAAVGSVRSSLDQIRGGLPLSTWSSLETQWKSLRVGASRKDDSLVASVVELYTSKGEDAALAYIDKVLKKLGVSEEKVAAASTYVLSHGAHPVKRDSLIDREVDQMSAAKSGTEINIDGIRERAKQKAKAKADSIRIADERNTEALVLEIYSLLERGKIDDAFTRFNANLVALETYVNKDALGTLSTSVSQAYSQWREEKAGLDHMIATVAPSTTTDHLKDDREKAAGHISQIYAMLEKGKTRDAYEHFTRYRDKLKQYVCKEAFDMVESTVTQAWGAAENLDKLRAEKK
jgi:hypothetical protein